ncbi:translation initiation factor IF-2-like [Elephas maximus indicus]|uniref:translation initiation factor IF-2-like n=1 Tax=Elephas maximus indicus TaxID=99487 RepID=UPI002116315E|nr:translation initiation factor IF-2-like [Elephas maximus indicus]
MSYVVGDISRNDAAAPTLLPGRTAPGANRSLLPAPAAPPRPAAGSAARSRRVSRKCARSGSAGRGERPRAGQAGRRGSGLAPPASPPSPRARGSGSCARGELGERGRRRCEWAPGPRAGSAVRSPWARGGVPGSVSAVETKAGCLLAPSARAGDERGEEGAAGTAPGVALAGCCWRLLAAVRGAGGGLALHLAGFEQPWPGGARCRRLPQLCGMSPERPMNAHPLAALLPGFAPGHQYY